MAACVLSAPYDVPGWMPAHLETLARWAEEPSPVKESVRWAFGEFKKTHQDTWAQTKAAFTSEQWGASPRGWNSRRATYPRRNARKTRVVERSEELLDLEIETG